MDVPLMISTAFNTLKFAKEALQVTLRLQVENESREKINAALEKVGNVQDSLFELREALLQMQTENDRLRADLKAHDEWEAQKASYKLTKTPGGAVVYRASQVLVEGGTPDHFVCPNCLVKREIQILQDRRVAAGLYDCPGCKAAYPVRSAERLRPEGPRQARTGPPQF